MDENWLEVKVWGEWACFTRPEMKAERVSYPVMTPSAARGVLEAIFWKPQFQWQVREIAVLKPPQFFSILRNEVNSKASPEKASRGYFGDDESERAQRHTLALRDVAYIIRAEAVLKPEAAGEHPAKYRDQFRRRVERGQCYFTPYPRCREFAASFGPPSPEDTPIQVTEGLGQMLFDMVYGEDGSRTPRFFDARLERGVVRLPPELYREGGG